MQYFPYLNDLDFWSGIKDGLESVMYLYNAFFALFNLLILIVSVFISYRLFKVTSSTLNEIMTQRIEMYKPLLVLENKYFQVSFSQKNDTFAKKYFCELTGYNQKNKFLISEHGKFREYYLIINNIGLGSAKDVDIHIRNIRFDFLHEYNEQVEGKYKFIYHEKDNKIEYFNFHKYHNVRYVNLLHDQAETSYLFSHIMPNTIDSIGIPVKLPALFTEIIDLFLINLINLKSRGIKVNIDKINICFEVQMSYRDISNNSYSLNYICTIKIDYQIISSPMLMFLSRQHFTSPTNLSQKA